jgi:hypothetical protein
MTLAELENTLPNGNGFHDSYIASLSADSSPCELTLRLLDGEVLQVSNSGANWADVIDAKIISAKIISAVNGSAPFYSFSSSHWKSCIHIAATDATYEWTEKRNNETTTFLAP